MLGNAYSELAMAMRAHIKHVFKSVNMVVMRVLDLQNFLLAVGVKIQRLIRLLLDFGNVHCRNFLFIKELVNIHKGCSAADALCPFWHGEVGSAGTRHINVGFQPFKEIVGSGRNGGRASVLAHKSRRVNYENSSLLNNAPHFRQILEAGLELLLWNNAYFVHRALEGQGAVKRIADNEGHRRSRGTNKVNEVQRRLVVCNNYKWPLFVLYLVAQHLALECDF